MEAWACSRVEKEKRLTESDLEMHMCKVAENNSKINHVENP